MEEKRELEAVLEKMKAQFESNSSQELEEEMSDQQLNTFLEAITIIFEKCNSKEECLDAINRIQAKLTKEA